MKKFDITSDICHIGWQVVSKDDINPEVTFYETEGYKDTKGQMKEASSGEILFGHRIVHTLAEKIGGGHAKKVKPKTIQYIFDRAKNDWVMMDKKAFDKVGEIDDAVRANQSLWNRLKGLSLKAKIVLGTIIALVIAGILFAVRAAK